MWELISKKRWYLPKEDGDRSEKSLQAKQKGFIFTFSNGNEVISGYGKTHASALLRAYKAFVVERDQNPPAKSLSGFLS